MTGASGGMLAAAYFVISRGKRDRPGPESSIVELIQRDVAGSQAGLPRDIDVTQLAVDSLSAVASQLVQRDMFYLASPWTHAKDRGVVLESQWPSLAVSFRSLQSDELGGTRPSLILSPVLVETGQPLLISNLDLSSSVSTRNANTLQFFRIFPKAHASFNLQTAVRMNASFPYISPSISLPTEPKRRVVDAGYYDNYGVSTAVSYLRDERVMMWLRENTGSIILIQIRAYPIEANVADVVGEHCREAGQEASAGSWRFPGDALQWLTTPFDALMSARQAAMVVRNEQQLRMLAAIYNQATPSFLQTVTFENTARASLSWYLPKRELDCMREQLNTRHNERSFNALVELWHHR